MTPEELSKRADEYVSAGQYRDAMPIYERLVEIYEKDDAPEHTKLAAILKSLGETYYSQGMYEKAEVVSIRKPLFDMS